MVIPCVGEACGLLIQIFQGIANFTVSHQKLFLAFGMGWLGSSAYLTSLYFKFVGLPKTELDVVLEPFKDRNKDEGRRKWVVFLKCAWYSCIGGCIAVVFQWDVANFVPVQSLILGVTWPTVVTQFLSGRLAGPTRNEMDGVQRMIDDIPRPSRDGKEANKIEVDFLDKLKQVEQKGTDSGDN